MNRSPQRSLNRSPQRSLIKSLPAQTLIWLVRRQLSVGALLVLVLASAVGVSVAVHQTRQIYAGLQDVRLRSDNIDSEYEKLLLEQSAWADYARVDQVSRKELGMVSPLPDNVVVVKI